MLHSIIEHPTKELPQWMPVSTLVNSQQYIISIYPSALSALFLFCNCPSLARKARQFHPPLQTTAVHLQQMFISSVCFVTVSTPYC